MTVCCSLNVCVQGQNEAAVFDHEPTATQIVEIFPRLLNHCRQNAAAVFSLDVWRPSNQLFPPASYWEIENSFSYKVSR